MQVSSWKAAVSNCPATFMLLLRKGGNPKCGPVFHRNSGIGRTVCLPLSGRSNQCRGFACPKPIPELL